MSVTTSVRAAAVVILSFLLMGTALVGPAAASPQTEGQFLSALKQAWPQSSRANQVATCAGYRASAPLTISGVVTQLSKDSRISSVFNKPALKRIITKYLAWACSGPGTTPRR